MSVDQSMAAELRIEEVWSGLEKTISGMEAGEGDWFDGADVARAAIQMLLEFEDGQIAGCIEASKLPSRATKRWFVYEAARIKLQNPTRIRQLAQSWAADIQA